MQRPGRRRRTQLWLLAGFLIGLAVPAQASALPRVISWASPHGLGGPFAQTNPQGVEFPSTNGVSDVCGTRREIINPNLQSLVTAVTPDGSRVFFTTFDRLSAADTDAQKRDIYEFSGGQTKLISEGIPVADHAYLFACSADGSRVIFGSTASLSLELWERSGGATTQVNVSETGENNAGVGNVAISADGTKVMFDTYESLTADDADSPAALDVFERSANDTKLVSTPGSAQIGSTLAAVSADGNTIWFNSADPLAGTDANTSSDVYVSQNLSAPAVVSINPTTGTAAGGSSVFRGVTGNEAHAFFSTNTGVDAADTDDANDLYDRTGSATTWISQPDAGQQNDVFPQLSAVAADGSRVYFSSDGQLKSTDTDNQSDLYLRTATGLVHVTRQVAGGASSVLAGCTELSVIRGCASLDASRIFFSTQERLLAADTDTNGDIYRFTAPSGPLQLVSGTGATENQLGGVSETGTRAIFDTADRLIPCLDNDNGGSDVYEWDNGALTLVSPPVGTSDQGNVLSGMSSDAATVFFASNAAYAGSGDDGNLMDLFAARPGGTAATCPGAANPFAPVKAATAPTARAVLGKTASVGRVSGTVRVRRKGSKRFVTLTGDALIPVGSTVDTLKGRVRVTVTIEGGNTNTAQFFDGVFQVLQRKAKKPVAEMRLAGRLQNCKTAKRSSEVEAARKRKGRRLWGKAKGRFRTRGSRSAATVRGTTWLVEDRCDRSTLTRVADGRVAVRDFARRKTVNLKKGGRYVAKPKGRRR